MKERKTKIRSEVAPTMFTLKVAAPAGGCGHHDVVMRTCLELQSAAAAAAARHR